MRRVAGRLRADGAELVVLLSHMGLDPEHVPETDDVLARELAGDVDLILGAHSHHELPDGLRVGDVLIAQAGSHARWLGRVDLDDGRATASLLPVTDAIPPHPRVLEAVERAERDLSAYLDEVLDEVIAVLDEPLDAARVAELLRRRFDADVGLAVEGAVLDRPLPAGPLRRGDLWEACHTGANPGVANVPGRVLLRMLERGASREFQEGRSRSLRGRARGPLRLAGPAEVEADRTYRVAATDVELGGFFGLADERLEARYDFPTILREAIAEELGATGERLERPVVQGDAVAPEGATGREQPLP